VIIRGVALAVRFACELAMLAALFLWGTQEVDGPIRWLFAVGAPALAATVWGLFVAPKARRPVSIPVRLAIEAVVFGAAVAGLLAVDRPVLAWTLGGAAALTSIINAATEPETERAPAPSV